MRYVLTCGTVQCYVARTGGSVTPLWIHHFGRVEYDRDKPVLSDRIHKQAQPIVDQLNAGSITQEQAVRLLDRT